MDRTAVLDQLHAQFAVPRSAVIELVQRVCGQSVTTVERLIHGDENEVYRVHLARGSTVFVRISRPDTPALRLYREAWAMEHARRAGVPVPDVVTVEPIASHEGDRHAMVIAAADGQQLDGLLASMSTGRRADTMREFGRVLAKLHTVAMPGRHSRWQRSVAQPGSSPSPVPLEGARQLRAPSGSWTDRHRGPTCP